MRTDMRQEILVTGRLKRQNSPNSLNSLNRCELRMASCDIGRTMMSRCTPTGERIARRRRREEEEEEEQEGRMAKEGDSWIELSRGKVHLPWILDLGKGTEDGLFLPTSFIPFSSFIIHPSSFILHPSSGTGVHHAIGYATGAGHVNTLPLPFLDLCFTSLLNLPRYVLTLLPYLPYLSSI